MFLRKLLLTIGVKNPPKFHHKGTKWRSSAPTWGIEMAEKMGIEGLHSVRGEAVFEACLSISWFCPWAGSSIEW